MLQSMKWSLSVKFKSRELQEEYVKELFKSNVDYDFTVSSFYSDNSTTYCVDIEYTVSSDNLKDVSKKLNKVMNK